MNRFRSLAMELLKNNGAEQGLKQIDVGYWREVAGTYTVDHTAQHGIARGKFACRHLRLDRGSRCHAEGYPARLRALRSSVHVPKAIMEQPAAGPGRFLNMPENLAQRRRNVERSVRAGDEHSSSSENAALNLMPAACG